MIPDGVTIYFIRHGETDWNAAKRYQGQTDIPLNDKGRGQAARNGRTLAGTLSEREIGALDFVASPLMRTRETMEIVRSEMGLDRTQFRQDDRLKEIHFGHWEGELWDELPVKDPIGFERRRADTWGWVPRGGESYRMLADRLDGLLGEIRRDTVMVSHGGVSRVVRGHLLELESARIPHLEVPQDLVLRLRRGEMAWL